VVTLAASVPDGATLLVDSAPIIYVLEGSPLSAPFESVFADIDAGRIQGLITPITLAEVVSGPLAVGRDDLAERYRHAISVGACEKSMARSRSSAQGSAFVIA
jgi:hypothetical protein